MSLQSLPLPAVFIITVLLALFSIACGHRAGTYMHVRSTQEQAAPVGGMVGAVLALLADGMLRVGQEAMVDLQKSIAAPP